MKCCSFFRPVIFCYIQLLFFLSIIFNLNKMTESKTVIKIWLLFNSSLNTAAYFSKPYIFARSSQSEVNSHKGLCPQGSCCLTKMTDKRILNDTSVQVPERRTGSGRLAQPPGGREKRQNAIKTSWRQCWAQVIQLVRAKPACSKQWGNIFKGMEERPRFTLLRSDPNQKTPVKQQFSGHW
jgi:hypothetical protein